MKQIILPRLDIDRTLENLENFMVDKTLNLNYSGGVLGLSGGVDSTLVATVANRAYSRYNDSNSNETPLSLKGVIMPSSVNNPKDEEDGNFVGETLGIDYEVKSIEKMSEALEETIPELSLSEFNSGNARSRSRAQILHTLSGLERRLILGTGNRDEDVGIGYYTLFGDGAIHVSLIADLSKRHVRELLMYLEPRFEHIAQREPTAGLEEGQTDFTDLGYSYDTVELLLEGLEQGINSEKLFKHSQVIEQVESELDRSKYNTVDEVVSDFLRRNHSAKKKAELLSPPIAQAVKIYE